MCPQCLPRRLAAGILALTLVFATAGDLAAQKPAGLKRFAVDFLTLKSGERLRGALLGQDTEGIVSIAVQRDWLAAHRPTLLAEHAGPEREAAVKNAALLRYRIKNWIDETDAPQLKIAFLETELDRAETALKNASSSDGLTEQFLILRFRREEIATSFVQPPENRQIAVVAWSEKLEQVEQREIRDLLEELKKNGIENPADEAVDLTDRVPPQPEGDREWAVRRAIVDYHFGRKLDFQGVGETLFRTGESAGQINLAHVLPQILQSQLSSLDLIGDILNEPGFGPAKPKPTAKREEFKTAIAEAGKEGASSFRVTRLDLETLRLRATVTQQFVVKMPDGSWQAAWKARVAEDASKPHPELLKQIENDPQIAQVRKIFGALGGARDNQLEIALGFGAATMAAQKAADRQFFEFRDRYLRRLDGPPVRLPAVDR